MPKSTKPGFTLVEMLVVVALIALLAGILIPVVKRAMDRAKEAAVQTQIQKISTGLETYKLDFGAYPSSLPQTVDGVDADADRQNTGANHVVQGFHRLAFAMIGRDRLGCPAKAGATETTHGLPHDSSNTRPDSITGWYYSSNPAGGFTGTYRPYSSTYWAADYKTPRKGPYVNPEDFPVINDASIDDYVPVLCDKMNKQNDNITDRSIILYFAANPRGVRIGGNPTTSEKWLQQQYFLRDNWAIDRDSDYTTLQRQFWDFIRNPKAAIGNDDISHNRETYLLISPGLDGTYFTPDDIKNWTD